MSWTLGLRQLGWRVAFLEQIAPETCVDATGAPVALEDSVNADYFREVIRRFDLVGSAALINADGHRTLGAVYADLVELADAADLLINISGHLAFEPLFRRFKRRVYLDLDPGFTQIWYADASGDAHLEAHHSYFTVGENIGSAQCTIPTCGIPWRPIRQPVLLDEWPLVDPATTSDRFTSVASWRGPYGPLQYGGQVLGLKVHEFRKFITLPHMAQGTYELALDIHPADHKDLDLLSQHRWRVVDPERVAGTPDLFRQYVQTSSSECSVAQGVYVHTRSGWFSDRSVRYLASGKPVLVQDTGFSEHYPVGRGLVAFSTLDEAVTGVERIIHDYARHRHAARALAEEHFAADKVLHGLLTELELA